MSRAEDKQPGVCSEFSLGSEALEFMWVSICGKSRSPETKNGEKKRKGCKRLCGELRV